jgi:formyltetrahydrofolate deformylase
MRLVWYLSSIPGDGSPQLIPHLDKLMHFLGFAVGGMLMAGLLGSVTLVLMRRKVRWDLIIPATAILIGLFGWLDEWHQCFTPGRHGADLADWVADFLGGIAGALFFRAIFHRLIGYETFGYPSAMIDTINATIKIFRMARPGLILKLSCPDQAGIVAKIANYVASHRGNLVEFNQFSDSLEGKFFARLEIETNDLDVQAQDFIDGFGTLGRSLKAEWHFRPLPYRMRTALLVTKTDHCLNEILWRTELGELPIEITSIIGNRPNCRPIADRSNIPFHEIDMDGDKRSAGFAEIRKLIVEQDVELIVLARFMQILPNDFCRDFAGRIINIHHSFLPAFIGANPYKQAYERGVKLIGATCHYVTADLDAGPIIEQEVERVHHFHTPNDLVRLGRNCERIAIAKGIRYHVHDRTIIDGHRAIVFPD